VGRLINELLSNKEFLVDDASLPYIVRDIINMNWWNTCEGYLIGYQKGRRVSAPASHKQKLIGIILKEFYRWRMLERRDVSVLQEELAGYISGTKKSLAQLKIFSMPYRRNDSQYFYQNGQPTWLDCTSRATYAWKYVGQNGYLDFDGVVRVLGGDAIVDFCRNHSVYPHKDELETLFAEGDNSVKAEIFSQKKEQRAVQEWVERLSIDVIPEREWLFDAISHVRTDPYKNYEKSLLAQGKLTGVNELLYGFKTMASVEMRESASYASRASAASEASRASEASDASAAGRASAVSDASYASAVSDASYASRASNASAASNASRASDAGVTTIPPSIQSWFDCPTAIGELEGLDHPPVFLKNKYGIAGHWKINKELVESCKLGWIDPFLGHGESPLFAKKLGKPFVGIEINPDSMNGYILPYIQKACDEDGLNDAKIDLRLADSAVFMPDLVNRFDLCYTSPPYFNFEDYGFHNKTILECDTYDEFHERVTKPVFRNVMRYLTDDGVLALQTEKNKTKKQMWIEVMESIGFRLMQDGVTGQEAIKYSNMSKRDQSLLIFKKPLNRVQVRKTISEMALPKIKNFSRMS
jgi:hypothetical protein